MDTLKDLIDKLKSESVEPENKKVIYGDNRRKITKFCTDSETMYETITKWYALASSVTYAKGVSLWLNSKQRLDIKGRESERFTIVYIDYSISSLLDETCIEKRISKYIRN